MTFFIPVHSLASFIIKVVFFFMIPASACGILLCAVVTFEFAFCGSGRPD